MRRLLARQLDQLAGLGAGGGHRLVEVHVLAGAQGLASLLIVQADRRGDGHGVHLAARQQVVVAGEGPLDAEARRGSLGAAGHGVTDGRETHAILHVVHCQMRQDAAHGDTPRADDTQPYDIHAHNVPFPLALARPYQL